MMLASADLCAALRRSRFSLEREKETQAEIAADFALQGIHYQREFDLGDGNIIDFMVDNTGIEVKLGGSKRKIYAQCERYCKTGKLSGLILATNTAIGFPPTLHGVPCFIVSLGRAWL